MKDPGDISPHIDVLFERALDAVVGMDDAGNVIAWNNSAEQIFGWTAVQALGASMGGLIVPHQHRAAHDAGLARFLKTGEGPVLNSRFQITALNSDGKEFPVELSIIPISGAGGRVFYAFIRSLEEQENSRRQLQQRAIEAEILFEISQKLVDDATSQELTEFCLQKICEVTGCSMGHLYEADLRGATAGLRSSGLSYLSEARFAAALEISGRAIFAKGQGLPGRVWATGEPLVIGDLLHDPAFHRGEAYAALGLTSGFAFPVRRRGQIRAVMEFFSSDRIPLDDNVLKMAYTISGHISLALDRKEESESRELLRRELAHRVGNSMSILASIFRNCCNSSASVAELQEAFETRLLTIGRANRHFIEAADSPASLRSLIEEGIKLFPGGSSVAMEGPEIEVMSSAIMPISLMLHELVTNALKHGAMSLPQGNVSIHWRIMADRLEIAWREQLHEPASDTGREGYGTVLIRAVLERMLNGRFERTYRGKTFSFVADISGDHFQPGNGQQSLD